ncbi:MAG: hypothetical protein HKL90_15545, partial [Elusimicrobia bacterium]|nr:hypothetical protein [Elusimicrobiota bacterium]
AIVVLVAAAAGIVFWSRRRAAYADILRAYGPDVHPDTAAALAAAGENNELARDGLWLRAHERELSERFRRQWVAVVNGEVLAVSVSAENAWKAARGARPDRVPFVRRLP